MSHSSWYLARAAPLLLLGIGACASHDATAPRSEVPTPPPATPEVQEVVIANLGSDPVVIDLVGVLDDATVTIAGVDLTSLKAKGQNARAGDAATQDVARATLTHIVETALLDASH